MLFVWGVLFVLCFGGFYVVTCYNGFVGLVVWLSFCLGYSFGLSAWYFAVCDFWVVWSLVCCCLWVVGLGYLVFVCIVNYVLS